MLIKLSVGVNTPIITRIITNSLKTVSRLKTRHSSLSHTAETCGTWILPVWKLVPQVNNEAESLLQDAAVMEALSRDFSDDE